MRSLLPGVLVIAALAAPARAQDLDFGSNPAITLELHAQYYNAGTKSRSHFGFNQDGMRQGETGLKRDLGFSSTFHAFGVDGTVNLGPFGWIGGEILGWEERNNIARISRMRRVGDVSLVPGDIVHSGGRVVWGGLEYGYEVRVKILDDLAFALSPAFGAGFFDFEADFKRMIPEPTPNLGKRAVAFVLAPGFRASIEAFGIVRLGVDGEFGLNGSMFAVSAPHPTLWERYRVFLGVNLFCVDLTVGWRMDATHLVGDGKNVDLRQDGAYFRLGVRF